MCVSKRSVHFSACLQRTNHRGGRRRNWASAQWGWWVHTSHTHTHTKQRQISISNRLCITHQISHACNTDQLTFRFRMATLHCDSQSYMNHNDFEKNVIEKDTVRWVGNHFVCVCVCRVGGSGYVWLRGKITSRTIIQAGGSYNPSQQGIMWLVERRSCRG